LSVAGYLTFARLVQAVATGGIESRRVELILQNRFPAQAKLLIGLWAGMATNTSRKSSGKIFVCDLLVTIRGAICPNLNAALSLAPCRLARTAKRLSPRPSLAPPHSDCPPSSAVRPVPLTVSLALLSLTPYPTLACSVALCAERTRHSAISTSLAPGLSSPSVRLRSLVRSQVKGRDYLMRGKTTRGPGLCAGSPLDSPRLARLRPPLTCAPFSHDPLARPKRFAPFRLPQRETPSCSGGKPSSLRSASLFHPSAPLQDHGCLLISYPPLLGSLSSAAFESLPRSRSSSRTPRDNSRNERKTLECQSSAC
jgi:hypothetical protein